MPLTLSTSEGPLEISDEQIQAIIRHAHRRADLTAATLDVMGIFQSAPCRLPAGFLLELSAVLELALWERQGLQTHLDVDLPTYREAADALASRAAQGIGEFEGPDAAPLSQRVLHVWMERFAWDGPALLGSDVILGGVDEDEFAALLAEFLFEHRHDLSNLIRSGKE